MEKDTKYWHDYLAKLETFQSESRTELQNIHAQGINQLKERVGPLVELMLQGQEETVSFLEHANVEARFAALCLLANHWPRNERAAHKVEALLKDRDEKVRGAAILCLDTYYKNSRDPRIAKLLSEIARNQSEAQEVRRAAYFGLIHIVKEWLEWPSIVSFRFPEDVDWECVNSYC